MLRNLVLQTRPIPLDGSGSDFGQNVLHYELAVNVGNKAVNAEAFALGLAKHSSILAPHFRVMLALHQKSIIAWHETIVRYEITSAQGNSRTILQCSAGQAFLDL